MHSLPDKVEPETVTADFITGWPTKSSEAATPIGKDIRWRPDGVRPAPLGKLQSGQLGPKQQRQPELATGVCPQVSGLVSNLLTE